MIDSTVPDVSGFGPSGYRGAAIALSVLGHGIAIGVLVLLTERALEPHREEPPIRLVFVEPAPPPRLGTPGGGATATAPAAAPALAPAQASQVAPAAQPVEEKHAKPAAHLPAQAATRPVPHAAAPAQRAIAPAPRPAEVAPQTDDAPAAAATAGSSPGPAGVADGDAAGVEGGLPGGRVGGLGTEVLPVGQAAVAPAVVRQVMPVYPEIARARGIEGQVILEAIVALDGHIEPDIKIVHSIPALDTAAIEAFRRWQFSPARDAAGKPVRVILQAPVRFVLR